MGSEHILAGAACSRSCAGRLLTVVIWLLFCCRLIAVAEDCLDGAHVFVYHARRLFRQKSLATPEVEAGQYVSLSFSPDEALLLSLGAAPDWRLVCWHLDSGKPLAIHQVTSTPELVMEGCSFCPTNPTKLAVWGSSVLKFLSLEDDQRISVLPHSSRFTERPTQTYLAHCWLPDDLSVVATASGDLLLFRRELFECVLSSSPSASAESEADAGPAEVMVPYEGGFLTGGAHGLVRLFAPSDDEGVYFRRSRRFLLRDAAEHNARIHTVAVSPSQDSLAVMTGGADMLSLDLTRALKKEETRFTRIGAGTHGPPRDRDEGWGPGDPSAAAAVTGLDVCTRKPLIATTGIDGCLRLWNYVEKTQELCEPFGEVLLCVALHPSGLQALVGFSDTLKLCNILLDNVVPAREITIKNCREARFARGGHLFAAANGFLIQVYDAFTCDLLVTLRGHSSPVRSIRWAEDDETMTSAGLDGAVYRWSWRSGKRVSEFVNKQDSYTAAESTQDGVTAYAVGVKGFLEEVEFASGSSRHAVAHDVVHGQLALSSNGRMLFSGWADETLAGCVASYAIPIDADAPDVVTYPAASAEVTRMMLTHDDTHLIVTGADGSVLVMEVRDKEGRIPLREASARLPWADEVLMTKGLLEEMATSITKLSEKYEELVSNNDYNMRMKEIQFQERMKKVQERYQAELDQEKTQLQLLKEETEDLQREYGDRLTAMEVAHRAELQKREAMYQAEIMGEVSRFQQLKAEWDASGAEQRAIRQRLVDDHERHMSVVRQAQDEKLAAAQQTRRDHEKSNADRLKDWRETQGQMEGDLEEEVEEMKRTYQTKHEFEKTTILRYRSENGVLTKKFEALKQEIEEQEEEIRALKDAHGKREKLVADLRLQIKARVAAISEKDGKIGDKEKQIYELKKKNQELEKYKFVLDYKIKELKRQIEPRETEIQAMRKQIKEVDAELEAYHKVNAKMDEQIGELRAELDALQASISRGRGTVRSRKSQAEALQSDLEELSSLILDPAKLRTGILAVHARHVPKDLVVARADGVVVSEYAKQEQYLADNLKTLSAKLARTTAVNASEMEHTVRRNLALITDVKELRTRIASLREDRSRVGSAPAAAAASAAEPASARSRKGPGTAQVDAWRRAKEEVRKQIGLIERALGAANPASRVAAGAT